MLQNALMVPPLQFAAVLSRESEVGNGILASLELGVFFWSFKLSTH